MNIINELKKELFDIIRYRYVVFYFVYTKMKVRYKRSTLGYLWTVLAPVTYYLVLGLVFSYGFRISMSGQNYLPYMISGAIFFNTFATIIGQSCNLMINNENFIKKIYIPKMIFVLNLIFYEFTNMIIIFVSVSILGYIFGLIQFSWHILFIVISFLLAILFLCGVSIITSILSLYFRDLIQIIPVIMQIVFFATPIFWFKENVPPLLVKLNYFNPFFYFVEMFRLPLISNQLPALNIVIVSFFISIFVFLLGLFFLYKFNNRIIFKL